MQNEWGDCLLTINFLSPRIKGSTDQDKMTRYCLLTYINHTKRLERSQRPSNKLRKIFVSIDAWRQNSSCRNCSLNWRNVRIFNMHEEKLNSLCSRNSELIAVSSGLNVKDGRWWPAIIYQGNKRTIEFIKNRHGTSEKTRNIEPQRISS